MPSAKVTVRTKAAGGVRNHIIVIEETDTVPGFEVRLPNIPKVARIICVRATSNGGAVQPSVGYRQGWVARNYGANLIEKKKKLFRQDSNHSDRHLPTVKSHS